MDLGRFYADAGEPDGAFHDDSGEHGAGGERRKLDGFLGAAGEKLLDGFFEDLHEGYDHDLKGWVSSKVSPGQRKMYD